MSAWSIKISHSAVSTVHSLQSKQNGTTSPQWTGTNDLNIYSSFSYQTSWEIMNISANIRLNKSLETDGELAFFFYFQCWPTFSGRWSSPLLLDILMFTQSLYNIKTRRAHLDVYGSRIKEQPGFKLPCVDKKGAAGFMKCHWCAVYIYFLW